MRPGIYQFCVFNCYAWITSYYEDATYYIYMQTAFCNSAFITKFVLFFISDPRISELPEDVGRVSAVKEMAVIVGPSLEAISGE